MATVLTAAAEDGVSVLLSSHVLAELERVADYLILMSRGRVQVAGEVDDLLASHRVLTGPAAEAGSYAERPVVHVRRGAAQAHLLIRATAYDPVPPGWEAHPVGLEELALAYLREPGAAALAAGLFTLLMSWYYQPYFAAGNQTPQTPLFPGLFGLRGVAFAAWTLAAFAIGALAGMLIRRVVPAIAATLAAYAGLAFATGLFLRQHYLTPLLTSNSNPPGSAWIISQQWQTKGGQPVSQSVLSQVLQGAPQLAGKGGVPKSLNVTQYLNQHGYTLWTSYQPGSRFWPFQWIEGGWLLALSVLLIAATVWLVRRRAA